MFTTEATNTNFSFWFDATGAGTQIYHTRREHTDQIHPEIGYGNKSKNMIIKTALFGFLDT